MPKTMSKAQRVGDLLLAGALITTFPIAVLVAVAHGQAAGVATVAVAMVLMLAGWVMSR